MIRNIVFIVWCLLLIITASNLTRCNSLERADRNIENSEKLKVGMTLDEALKIMGEPHEVKAFPNMHPKYKSATTVYFYESPIGASDLISFEIDSTKTVVEVTLLEPKN